MALQRWGTSPLWWVVGALAGVLIGGIAATWWEAVQQRRVAAVTALRHEQAARHLAEGSVALQQGACDQAVVALTEAVRLDPAQATAGSLLAEARQTLAAASERRTLADRAPTAAPSGAMVLIPAGSFAMGSEEGEEDEKPVHRVTLSAFWIDRTEVTVAAYRACVQAGACSPPDQGGACTWGRAERDEYPVNCVDWIQATGYCTWAAKRLPTEAEWEQAARGPQGCRYSWGNGPPVGRRGGNVADESARRVFPTWTVVAGYDDGYAAVAPVGRFDPNAHGLYDMSGNLWEWVVDWYDPGYYSRGSRVNPLGPATGQTRLVRGGSWRNAETWLRVAYRYGLAPGQRLVNVGFRCAR